MPEKIVKEACDLELLILNSDFAQFDEKKAANEVLIEITFFKRGVFELKLLAIFDSTAALDKIMVVLGPI